MFSAKNFKNISYTLTTRLQMRMCSTFYNGMFETSPVVIKSDVLYKKHLNPATANHGSVEKLIANFMSDRDFLCKKLSYKGQIYTANDLVVLKVLNQGSLRIGLVHTMVVRNDKVFFVVKEYEAKRCWLSYYEAELISDRYVQNDARALADYKPLINYGSQTKLYFCLHHHISHDLD